jgi:hypothetical protein
MLLALPPPLRRDQRRRRIAGSGGEASGTLLRARLEAGAEDCAQAAVGVVPGPLQGQLETGENLRTKAGVGLGPCDQIIEGAPRLGKLPRRLHPALGGGGSSAISSAILASVHTGCALSASIRTQDARAGRFLPASSARSLSRQREIRLAIVPSGTPSAALIVR